MHTFLIIIFDINLLIYDISKFQFTWRILNFVTLTTKNLFLLGISHIVNWKDFCFVKVNLKQIIFSHFWKNKFNFVASSYV